jgi:hypothetical protein
VISFVPNGACLICCKCALQRFHAFRGTLGVSTPVLLQVAHVVVAARSCIINNTHFTNCELLSATVQGLSFRAFRRSRRRSSGCRQLDHACSACADIKRRDGRRRQLVSIVSQFLLFPEEYLLFMISPIPGLHPGSVFKGHQRSGKNSYPVTVEIKHVDFADSYMCGHLSIGGLVSGLNRLKCFVSLYFL